jgi:hypothetical protein
MSATKSEMIFLNSGAGAGAGADDSGFIAILHSFKYFCLNQYLAQLFYWDGGISFYGIYGIESVRGF